ncbi:AMP-binding protein [Formosa sediminum]|uniref:AMP-binding protein n=1 Tax=Formosa sediminum TaxID=2594004 RepID=A0A516GT98_9FLAO|nr:AMP-binding protein [Formosa sediminum]QDO94732.1 AMP-binding protein [Formosa sediminum]
MIAEVQSNIPTYDKIHLKFKLNGRYYDSESLSEVAYCFIKEGEPHQKTLGDFLQAWLDNNDYVEVQTSGSIGAPKKIKIKKQAMVNSAIATGNAFNLRPGDSLLHCLPFNFISGRMMLVRAMILGLELDVVPPRITPVFDETKTYDFSAMIPPQAENLLPKLHHFKALIIGGAAASHKLLQDIQGIDTQCYSTYGMTETVSHIAFRPLNGPHKTDFYKAMPNVKVSTNDKGCLVLEADYLFDGKLETNDVAVMHSENEFKLIGRIDNVINSGGLKLFAEQIEKHLTGGISQRFFVAGLPDDKLGERLVLVVEGEERPIDSEVFKDLKKNEIPKEIIFIKKFIETPNRKIQRKKTLELI